MLIVFVVVFTLVGGLLSHSNFLCVYRWRLVFAIYYSEGDLGFPEGGTKASSRSLNQGVWGFTPRCYRLLGFEVSKFKIYSTYGLLKMVI